MATNPAITSESLQHNTALIQRFFLLNDLQKKQFNALGSLYLTWNQRINLISRKDIIHLYLRHILHSLSIAKVVKFRPSAHLLDIGTGGGFPGIPLAILFPQTKFVLVDSIGKKIKVVQDIVLSLGLRNVTAQHIRAEQLEDSYDFVLSRAVCSLPTLYSWVKDKIKPHSQHNLANGLLCLKGGDLTQELKETPLHYRVYAIHDFFKDPFFTTKSIIHAFK